jgi:hypothetical protein
MLRWSTTPPFWPSEACGRAGRPRTDTPAATSSRGLWCAGSAVDGWTRTGPTDAPAYRCRHGYTSATPRPAGAPRNVYHREDQLIAALPGLLAEVGVWRTPTSGRAQQNPGDVLRRERLQIICAHQGVTLRRESSPDPTTPAIEPVQTAFELAWNSRAVVDQSGTLSVSAHGSI